ncbi:MAG TPA: adenylate/guanylate cyclase domain-containing protein [Nitrososphaeraceae archaeon]|nr:adenylate/guanylate cyclase domain-containing protein [Nitrososphaeraceae archaeon]
MDIHYDTVMQVIRSEEIKKQRRSENTIDNQFLNKLYLDAIIDIESVIKDSQVRIWKSLKANPEFNISLNESQKILEKFMESKIKLVILNIDLVGSTKMAFNLPIDRLTTIIRAFAQEMTILISMYGGYVLKYIGDAVLAFFVVDTDEFKDSDDNENKVKYSSSNDNFDSLPYSNVISCAYTMIKVVQEGINPILNQNDYPDLKVRIGINFGEIAVVMYGVDMDEYNNMILKRPHLDLIGYTISIVVKMTSLAQPDHIVIGEELYGMFEGKLKDTFKQLSLTRDLWNYSTETTGKIYSIYENIA